MTSNQRLSVAESATREKITVVKDTLKKQLQGTPLYSPARDAYQLLFNRSYWKHRKQMTEFYSQFCFKGDLVFDVGANVGWYTEMFLGLGAQVVAVEPNPRCVETLRTKRPRSRLAIEPVAVGSSESESPFFLCDDSSTHSTLSSEWMKVANDIPRLKGKAWSRTVNVPVTTVDTLIRKYGEPQFIKIDVEGFEQEVLKGLSKMPKYLSFEFISEFADAAIQCVNAKCLSEDVTFNVIVNDASGDITLPLHFVLNEWVAADELKEFLSSRNVREARTYGDIFVRRDA